ncbi:calcitonin gene-related peptide type 1 receptor-like isoform X2 [Photinus pyralis]|uniref:G-protein coupled receptors family 2 profile 2 domain-containing protein n=1 Tax=Photinus pyralis TaxID=7054 RepID=A0A1Y1M8Y7_PHOPY|nr:calcitonin gene-related peptide type 1 receptor-like isoform X2 [Photinus pyralis]
MYASEMTDEEVSETSELATVLVEKENECNFTLNATSEFQGLYCPGVFDGWVCWPDTEAGRSASHRCPGFIVGFDPERYAYRKCEENGEWFFHTVYNKTWSNYTTCVNLEELSFRQTIITVHLVGYSISLVALIVSLGILTYFKSLRCARITVHMNLFASFAANNLLWLLWYNLVVGDPDLVSANKIWCRVLHVVLYYFLLSNYSWMLCEGLYLHTVLVSAFISEVRLLRCMLLLGWGIPALTITLYAPIRHLSGDAVETSACWMNEGRYNIILQIPVCATVFLNVIFLFNILRVLLIKLRRGPHMHGAGSSGTSRTSLQALRATLLLVPLLGLNFLLTPFRPEENHPWERAYEVVSAVTASLQGLCVAILFCFCNGEVLAQMRRKWQIATFRTRANSCTVTTVSFVRTSGYPGGTEEKV